MDELNIKSMREAKDASALVTYKIKPQMKTLGPKYGKLLNGIRAFLETCDGQAVVSAVKGGGTFKTEIGGAEVELGEEDLLVSTESAEGYVSASDKGITVALNTALTPELVEEGVVRELISKLQTMRKEAGFEVTDRIRVYRQNSACEQYFAGNGGRIYQGLGFRRRERRADRGQRTAVRTECLRLGVKISCLSAEGKGRFRGDRGGVLCG